MVAKMIGDTKDVALSTYAHVLPSSVRAAEDRTQEALVAEAEREPADVKRLHG